MRHTNGNPYLSPLQWMQYIVFGAAILYFGRDIFIPVSFGLLISFILYPICTWMERKGIGRMSSILISVSVLIVFGALILFLLINQFVSFLQELPFLKVKLNEALQSLSLFLNDIFGLDIIEQKSIISKLVDQSGDVIRGAMSASVFSFVMLILIPVYAVLILYYRHHWIRILYRIFPRERKNLKDILALTIQAYYNFIKGMVLVYLIVGILNSIGLLILGIPHAILFGFIASILTFIPYIGIITGSLLPIAMAWITFDSIWYPLGVVAIFVFVQYLEANIIFPVAVSNRLKVNTLVMLISIFAGGLLWGMPGMILFVPFVGISKLIADHNPRWKTLSMMLGMK